MNYEKLAKQIFEQNKAVGWWDNMDRCIYETLQLVSTELAEATEGERKGLKDDHLTDRWSAEVELADALIRVLDLGGRYDWRYINDDIHWLLKAPVGESLSVAGQHFACNKALADLGDLAGMCGPNAILISNAYSRLINSIVHVAEFNGYDIEAALYEKLEFNRNRADHKRENRDKNGGKKF